MLRRRFAKIALGATLLLLWEGRAQAISPPVFMVFFDSDKAEIDKHGRHVIEQAGEYYQKWAGNQSVRLSCHTDTAEDSEALARDRCIAVRMGLAEVGVPFERITIFAHGAKDLLKRTPPKTKEGQNRRVEIVIL